MKFARIAALVTALSLPFAAFAQGEESQESAESTAPRLVVAIAVDQLSADIFAQHRQNFTGGFARMLQGAVFPSGYQAHAATETCPGHSTILTGAHPGRTGVIANRWFDMGVAREDVRVYCSEDPGVEGSSSSDYTVSTGNLLVPTLGDLMQRVDEASQVVSVAGKDRSAVMLGGANADRMFWPGDAGFTTFEGRDLPEAVTWINQAAGRAMASSRVPLPVPQQCAAYNRAIPVGEDATVGTHVFSRGPATSGRTILASPEGDLLTLNLAADLVSELGLGQGETTDLLAIGLASTDYIGHAYGTHGVEMCVQLMALDAMLGDFFARLDARGISYVAMLTADHGGLDLPERQTGQAAPRAARLLPGFETLDARLAEETGLEAPILRADGPFGDFYVDRSVPEDRRAEVIDRAIALISAHPQVYRVYGRDEIMAQPVTDAPPEHWTVLDRVRANFHPDRSGDFIVVLQPRVTPIPQAIPGAYVATHGSVWDYDRRVPILFWWPGADHVEQPLGVMTVDILPTLASLIGLDISDIEIDGRCLDLMPDVAASNCP
ncbi:alkaline phosphatase family protein [Parasphingopyxis algicola]|uniref:alkaline phosphatase family protein n=1 Tax=Parasphingopyxis algicola TaxID=2026624 RepID=UPI00159FC8E4|nr:alkaline phosphatase family protein [Parasphingopyxis algicola]QLC25091.1 alkaline phosphatase family protein [Parasphingopyxis algicola]